MPSRHDPVCPHTPRMLHGGDYNPDQWVATPEVWEDDARLMAEANCNTVSLGIFAWVALEPREGQFDFSWMDRVFEILEKNRTVVNLATPGGAKPAWMAQRYPETLRVDRFRRRQLWGGRHNHCFTSPVFRDKCRIINTELAERYGSYPYFGVWHVNNEYSGECHCDLCQAAFRDWLKQRYDHDLEKLNHAWWSRFWSHTITDWDHIESPSPIGEMGVHGLTIDWHRFCTHQTIECFNAESAPLRELTPNLPVTTNFMTAYSGIDYAAISRGLDVICWDSYPSYHDRDGDADLAMNISFIHEQRRAMLNKPFLLMECSPSVQNYKPFCKLKRPGVHILEGLQAVAHGADSVLYFQWRKGRGGFEKFHGAVVDHFPTTETRVFQEVKKLGEILGKLDGVVGTMPDVEVGLIYDYENYWAIDTMSGPRNVDKHYIETCYEHYRPFWNAGVPVDVIDTALPFDKYKLLIAPMLYMVKPGVAEKLEAYVRGGGTLVTTYMTGLVNETDLCFQNGFPGPLRELCGVWAEETDVPYDDEAVRVEPVAGNALGLSEPYEAGGYCDLLHCDTAEALATYAGEFYRGMPALTVNRVGAGTVYYVGSRNDRAFQSAFFSRLIGDLGLQRTLGDVALPPRVTATWRGDGEKTFVFVLSFNRDDTTLDLGDRSYVDVLTREPIGGKVTLPGYGHLILESA